MLRVFYRSVKLYSGMEEQTPNINVVHSVWRRLKKAKIRDLQPTKDVKGGSGVKDTTKPSTGPTENKGGR
jgi:hypothetical protein